MTPYEVIACAVTTALFLWLPRRNAWQSVGGSLLLGILWPLVLPVPVYFLTKRYLFKREFARERWILDVELYGCMAVGLVGFVVYLWLTGNPVLRAFQ